jgi:hypothetical protein
MGYRTETPPVARRSPVLPAEVYRKQRADFLELLRKGHTVTFAAEKVGVRPSNLYRWRAKLVTFAADWEEAEEAGVQVMEEEARRRAVDGTTKLVTVAGEAVEQVEYSDGLLMFLLKAKRPSVYRDNPRVEVTGAGGGAIVHEHEIDPARMLDGLAAVGLIRPRRDGELEAASDEVREA